MTPPESDHPEQYHTSIQNLCPRCRTPLSMHEVGDFNQWVCPQLHGIAITVYEAWGHLQDDEIHAMWKGAKEAPSDASLKAFESDTAMKVVDFTADDDEVEANSGPNARRLRVYVDSKTDMIWFDSELLGRMPTDQENPPEFTPEQEKQMQDITDQYGKDLVEGANEEFDDLASTKVMNFLTAHHYSNMTKIKPLSGA